VEEEEAPAAATEGVIKSVDTPKVAEKKPADKPKPAAKPAAKKAAALPAKAQAGIASFFGKK